ncbi:MAG TPA: ATP-binding cassette domain-containing protein, partial [Stellaceae bacterium]|nr:ATP-binding cassette domain-containing protein [Stellaceae bacterium]
PSPSTRERLELRRGITFSGVGFRYGNDDPPALRRLDLEIHAGTTVALVGRTGAGKSTLADLLLGLILPTEGKILLDDAPLDGDRLGRWRRSVGYVPQDNFLFNDTVRQNLLWAAPDATEQEIAEALAAASADRFVAALPRGLDTVIGERGVRLSGGERQRLALARALLHRPTLLVLDEATSALDSETERAVQAAIERLHGSRTIVIVAHRLSTIRAADCIFVLEAGALLQCGTWEELNRDREGRFAALLDASHALP